MSRMSLRGLEWRGGERPAGAVTSDKMRCALRAEKCGRGKDKTGQKENARSGWKVAPPRHSSKLWGTLLSLHEEIGGGKGEAVFQSLENSWMAGVPADCAGGRRGGGLRGGVEAGGEEGDGALEGDAVPVVGGRGFDGGADDVGGKGGGGARRGGKRRSGDGAEVAVAEAFDVD